MSLTTQSSRAVQANRVYRRRKAQLEAVRAELQQCLQQVDPRYTRELIPSKDVRAMFRKLITLCGEES